jgi:SAM-dependent methyltransferase
MHRLLREHYGELSGRAIVDLGCCRGQLLARFDAYPGVKLSAIEIDSVEAAFAIARGTNPIIHYINVFDGHTMTARLPFEDGSVEVMLAGEIIEHIVDTEGLLREIYRSLAPGGAVVLSTPNILWWKHRVELLFGRYPGILEHRMRYGEDFGHVRVFTPAILTGMLAEVGFENVFAVGRRLGSVGSLRLPSPIARILDFLADRLPALSDDVVAFAQRPLAVEGERRADHVLDRVALADSA